METKTSYRLPRHHIDYIWNMKTKTSYRLQRHHIDYILNMETKTSYRLTKSSYALSRDRDREDIIQITFCIQAYFNFQCMICVCIASYLCVFHACMA